QPGLLGEAEEERDGLLVHPVLRVVEVEPAPLDREALPAARIVGEERSQVDVTDGGVVRLERLPRRASDHRSGHRGNLRAATQPAFLSASLFVAIPPRGSFHDLTHASAPSFWSWAPSASWSMPALERRPSIGSASPPSRARMCFTSPCSAKARRVSSGIVFTVWGAARVSM